MNRSIWPSASELVDKPWGKERTWSTFGSLQGKVLYMQAGKKTSMKIFDHKDEVLYIQDGKIKATVADESVFLENGRSTKFRVLNLKEGDVLTIQAGCPYRLNAVEDSIVVEISNGIAGTDCVRFLDDYGRESPDFRTSLIHRKLEELEKE